MLLKLRLAYTGKHISMAWMTSVHQIIPKQCRSSCRLSPMRESPMPAVLLAVSQSFTLEAVARKCEVKTSFKVLLVTLQ